MSTPVLDWLSRVGTLAFVLSAVAFVLVNGLALLVFVQRKDRVLVNRWTGRILAANIAIVGTGLGIPVLTAVARVAVAAFSATMQPSIDAKSSGLEQIPAEATPNRLR